MACEKLNKFIFKIILLKVIHQSGMTLNINLCWYSKLSVLSCFNRTKKSNNHSIGNFLVCLLGRTTKALFRKTTLVGSVNDCFDVFWAAFI